MAPCGITMRDGESYAAGPGLAKASSKGYFEWCCFSCQQSAGKAVKTLFQALAADSHGHAVAKLMELLPESVAPSLELLDCAKELDKHYIPPRYPNAYASGAPSDFYTLGEAERAISHAERIVQFCEGHILRLSRLDEGP